MATQSQASLLDQLQALVHIANREGLYDAADWIRAYAENRETDHRVTNPDVMQEGLLQAIALLKLGVEIYQVRANLASMRTCHPSTIAFNQNAGTVLRDFIRVLSQELAEGDQMAVLTAELRVLHEKAQQGIANR